VSVTGTTKARGYMLQLCSSCPVKWLVESHVLRLVFNVSVTFYLVRVDRTLMYSHSMTSKGIRTNEFHRVLADVLGDLTIIIS
jgi:hypothetical protein